MSKTISEVQGEIKELLGKADLIEKKYREDPEKMPDDERREWESVLDQVTTLEKSHETLALHEAKRDQISRSLERYSRPAQAAFRPGYGDEAPEGKRISPGMQFLQNADYRTLKQNGAFNSNLARVDFSVTMAEGTSLLQWGDQKALLRGGSSSSGQAFVLEDHRPGFLDILQAPLNILDLIDRSPTDSDTIEYVREDTFTNSAAFVAEATSFTPTALPSGSQGVKPESALAYSTQTATVRTMAHWIPVTNRMLADAPAIRGTIDGRLLFGLQQKLQAQVVSGAGSGEDLTGILNAAGIGVVAKTAGTGDSVIDALYRGRTQVMWTGFGRPTAYVVNPADWQTVRLARETASTSFSPGGYLMGPPNSQGFQTLWGIPVVEDPNVPVGTALIGDFAQGATLFDREQGAVRVGTVNDQFIRNMQTILAELRVAFVVWRPGVFTKVTGLNA
jgi:HK97 family phage major capsid protein